MIIETTDGFCSVDDTYSGCVLAVGLSIETVKIPLLVVDVRHLVDKGKRCITTEADLLLQTTTHSCPFKLFRSSMHFSSVTHAQISVCDVWNHRFYATENTRF